MSTGRLFIAGLWVVGLLSGILLARAPDMLPLPMPYFLVPLVAGLAVELAIRRPIQSGQLSELSAGERAIGVLGGAVISFVAMKLLAPG